MKRIHRNDIFRLLALGITVGSAALSTPAFANEAEAAASTEVASTEGVVELPPPPASEPVSTVSEIVAIPSPVPYYIDRGTTMVPMRPICEFLGIKISALDGVLSFTQEINDGSGRFKVIALRIGGRSAQISELGKIRHVALSLPAETRLGNTFLPLRFVRDAFGATIGFRVTDNALVVTENNRRGVLTPPKFAEYRGSNAATLVVTNHVGRALSIRLGGPQSLVLELGKGQSVTRKVKPGVYYYKADSTGMQPRSGSRRLTGGRRSTWSWGRR